MAKAPKRAASKCPGGRCIGDFGDSLLPFLRSNSMNFVIRKRPIFKHLCVPTDRSAQQIMPSSSLPSRKPSLTPTGHVRLGPLFVDVWLNLCYAGWLLQAGHRSMCPPVCRGPAMSSVSSACRTLLSPTCHGGPLDLQSCSV